MYRTEPPASRIDCSIGPSRSAADERTARGFSSSAAQRSAVRGQVSGCEFKRAQNGPPVRSWWRLEPLSQGPSLTPHVAHSTMFVVEITACVDVGTVQFMYRLMGHNLAAHGFDVAIIAYSYYPYGSAASQADDVARAVVWYTHTIRRRRRCSVCVVRRTDLLHALTGAQRMLHSGASVSSSLVR